MYGLQHLLFAFLVSNILGTLTLVFIAGLITTTPLQYYTMCNNWLFVDLFIS